MKKIDILKDKFSYPIIMTLFFGLVFIKRTSDLIFIVTLLITMLTILCIVMILKEDNYLIDFNIDNDKFEISYQKNFKENIENKLLISSKTIKSIDFDSKFMFDSFHIISIKYIDEKGLHHQKKIKVDNNDKFIDLIYELKKNKN